MGLFDIDDDTRIRDLYHRAELEANRGYVDTRKCPYLDSALAIYAREHDCTYEDAKLFAKTGKKIGTLVGK